MLKASIEKAQFLIGFEKSLRFSLISFEKLRKISSILHNFFLNCPQILQNFSSNLLDSPRFWVSKCCGNPVSSAFFKIYFIIFGFSAFSLTNALLKTPMHFLWLALYFQKLLWANSVKWIRNTGLLIRNQRVKYCLQLQRFFQSILQFHPYNQCFRSHHQNRCSV